MNRDTAAPLLNPEQDEAVHTLEGPLLIIAGAGSGKTRVITHRISAMLKSGIPQSSILALTFTNKAAREMQERIAELSTKKLRQLSVSTFHAFGVQILKKHASTLGYRENFSIYDSSDQVSLLRESARTLGLSLDDLDFYSLIQDVSRVKTGRLAWKDVEDPDLHRLYDEYQSHLRLYNAVDFDDLIGLPLRLFKEEPAILEEYRAQYRYVLVDEFQDTSLNQYEFMRWIALGSRNVCVVGDDDQSIYSWRGANFENIRLFEKDFPERLEIKLEQNYRSTGTILEAANKLIANNKNRKLKALWTPAGGGKPIELFQSATEADEANFIAASIKEICLRDGLRYDDVGVLIRTNALARHIEEAFMASNLPYRMSGGTSFFQRPEVRDILAYLRVICNPDDDISLLRVLNVPRRGLGKKSLERITEIAVRLGSSLYGAMLELQSEAGASASNTQLDFGADLSGTQPGTAPEGFGKAAYGALSEFLDLIETYRPKFMSGKNLAQTLRLLVHEVDYWAHLVQEFQKNENVAKWRFRNVELLCSSLEQFEKNPDNANAGIFAYLNRVTLQGNDREDDEDSKGKVNLMTIHASKGLEFRLVFLAGVEDGIIPHKRSLMENEEGDYESNMEEERRLFYVAITRAQEKLVMSACRTRTMLRQSIESALSPFLQEIPTHLIEWKEATTTVPDDAEGEDIFSKMKSRFTGI